MAQYAILIYEAESGYADGGDQVWQTAMESHARFAGQVGEKGGKVLGGEALGDENRRPRQPAAARATGQVPVGQDEDR